MLAFVTSLAHFPFAGGQPPGGDTDALDVFFVGSHTVYLYIRSVNTKIMLNIEQQYVVYNTGNRVFYCYCLL